MRFFNRLAAVFASVFLVLGLLTLPTSTQPEAQAQTAPSVAEKCGATVALVVDLSASLTNTDLSNTKNALKSLINSLAGAPYNIGIYTFASSAPAYGGANTNMPAVSLQDPANVSALLAKIDGLYLPGQSSPSEGGTNWEGGLQRVAEDMQSGIDYDMVYFVTDGQPTFDNSGRNYAGNSTELSELNRAIAQKNIIQDFGTKVIPVGVGSGATSTTAVPVREWSNGGYNSINMWQWYRSPDWRIQGYMTPRQMLASIATDDNDTIVVRDYSALPQQLQSNFVTGCLFVNKNIVDSTGTVLEKGVGWEFAVTPLNFSATQRKLVTDQAGSSLTSFDGITTSSRVKITETAQSGFHMKDATCTAYKPGQQSAKIDAVVNKSTNSLEVALDPSKIISCTFDNVPLVPMSLSKEVVVADAALQQRLAGATFDFTYQCTYEGQTVASGEQKAVANGEQRLLGKVPLGTECVVKETNRKEEPSLYTVDTTWKGTNTKPGTTSSDGLTYTVQPDPQAYLRRGEATVTAVNTYAPKKASIQISKLIPNAESLPPSLVPTKFPVHYACRYVPTTADRPDAGAPVNPPNVASGTVLVPRSGVVEIGPFPVGTQCSLTEVDTAEHSVIMPGFDLTTNWQSNACDQPGDAATGGLNQCSTNYVWLDPQKTDQKFNLAVENVYERQLSNLIIEKTLSGDAAHVGATKEFLFDVKCAQEGLTAYEKSGIAVRGGQSVKLEDVPVGTTCTVTEQPVDIPNVDVKFPAAGSALVARPGFEDAKVVMNNELTYHKGPITLTKQVNVDKVADPAVAASLRAEKFSVSATCSVPGESEPRKLEHTISDNEVWTLGDFPVGTQCAFVEDFTPRPDIEFSYHLTPDRAAVESKSGADVVLENRFATPTGNLKVTKNVIALDEGVPDLEKFIPTTFEMDLTCTDGTKARVHVEDDKTEEIPNIKPGSECTLAEIVSDAREVERSTAVTGMNGTQSETPEGNPAYTFTVPLSGGAMALQVDNTYRPAMTTVGIDKQVTLSYANGDPVPENLKEAFLEEKTFDFTYSCKRGDAVVVPERGFKLADGGNAELEVPVNSTCEVTEERASLSGAQGPTISAAGDGAFSAETNSVTFANVTSPQKATVTNAYKLETGSFTVKKKVDGEGVATISRERKFDFSYRCTYRGEEVASGSWKIGRFDSGEDFVVNDLPIGTQCTVTEDPVTSAEKDADWSLRWNVSDNPSGWGNEVPCDNVNGCVTKDNSAVLTIVPQDNAVDGQHHQGAIVAWNTYTYHKVNLKLAKKLDGDGPEIAANDTFQMRMVCTDSRKADLPFELPDSTVTQTVEITGAGEVLLEKPVAAGWNCELTELPVDRHDAKVTASFDGAEREGDGVFGDDTAGVKARFTVQSGDKSTQTITVTNDYQRERAALQLTKELIGEQPNNVNAYLANKDSFNVTWTCKDPVTGKDLEGSTAVPSNGTPVPVTLDGKKQLPASATCTFTEHDEGKIPAGFKRVVNSYSGVFVHVGDEQTASVAGSKTIAHVPLSAQALTSVDFKNSYWVYTENFGLEKVVEGDPDGTIFPSGTEFKFKFTCDVANLLPGQPMPAIIGQTATSGTKATGTFTLEHGETWNPGQLPVESSCSVTELPLDKELQAKLDEQHLRMQANYVHLNESGYVTEQPADGNPTVSDRIGDATRIPLPDGNGVPLSAEKGSFALMVNSLYRTDGDVLIQKVNPGEKPLGGAAFAIYPVAEDGGVGAEPVVANVPSFVDSKGNRDLTKFKVSLEPGSYYLVETRSGTGAELLPKPWKFEVVPDENNPVLGNLKFVLADKTKNSGLVELKKEGTEDNPVWVIQVANVEAGDLPKSGSSAMAWQYGLAAVLLAIAGWVYWPARRKN